MVNSFTLIIQLLVPQKKLHPDCDSQAKDTVFPKSSYFMFPRKPELLTFSHYHH